jgi:hypothetical protein
MNVARSAAESDAESNEEGERNDERERNAEAEIKPAGGVHE